MRELDVCVSLRTEGVSILVDLTGGRLPALAHWGADLGDHVQSDAAVLVEGGVPPVVSNLVDEPVRLSLVPEHWTGWAGRPGITGSRAGRAWSPKFTTTSLTINGEPLELESQAGLVVRDGPALLEVGARDETAELDLTIRLELATGGLLRSQVELTNLGAEYTLNDCVLAYPVPPVARELFDMAGGGVKSAHRNACRGGSGSICAKDAGVEPERTRRPCCMPASPDSPSTAARSGRCISAGAGTTPTTRSACPPASSHRRRRATAARRDRPAPGRGYTPPWLYGVPRRRPRRGRPPVPPLPTVAAAATRRPPARSRSTSGRRSTSTMTSAGCSSSPSAAAAVGRRALRARRRMVRRAPRRPAGLGDWTVSPTYGPTGCIRWSTRVTRARHAVRAVVRAGDGQPRLRRRPRPPGVDHVDAATGCRSSRGTSRCSTSASRRRTRTSATQILAILRRVRDRLHQVGPQPRSRRRRHPAGRPARVHAQTLALYRLLDEIKRATPGWRSSPAPPEVPGSISESCNGPTASGSRTASTRCERQQMHRWTGQLIPPELMGAHIASAHSHTTGRHHDLDFRASTAIFGHLGVEWDLTQADPADLDELSEWIALFKKHREVLLTGTVTRMDFPDETFTVNGVVSTDLSTGIYALTSLGRSEIALMGRIRLPGLAGTGSLTACTPLMLEFPPSGLVPPQWWHVIRAGSDPYGQSAAHARSRFTAPGSPGVVLSGAALAAAGLSAPAGSIPSTRSSISSRQSGRPTRRAPTDYPPRTDKTGVDRHLKWDP